MKYLFLAAASLALLSGCQKDPDVPFQTTNQLMVSTQALTAVTQTSVSSGAVVSGGAPGDVIDKGLCWATTSNPLVTAGKRSGGAGNGTYIGTISGLTPGTTYYIRAYATTNYETIYGDQRQLNTLPYQLATLATAAAANITASSATGGGSVTSTGGGAVSARGVCWSMAQSPTISNSKTIDGSGTGDFNSSITGLLPYTVYYVRAYAINQAGAVYGGQVSFRTLALPASMGNVTLSSITRSTALAIASISADGGSPVTARGFCYSTMQNPTIANATLSSGGGSGSFSAALSGLVSGTTYYIRAYASNTAGISYSIQSSFRTL